MNRNLILPGGSELPKTLDVNLALMTYGTYENYNLGTDIYIFNGYSTFLLTSRAANGAVITLTLYGKGGNQVDQYTNLKAGFTCDVKGIYKCNLRLSGGTNKFIYGTATFS